MSEKQFTAMELAAFEAEKRNSEGMRDYIDQLVAGPDAAYRFAVDVRKAMVNELDPTRYKETAGRWPLLRKEFRKQQGLRPRQGLGAESGSGSSTAGNAIGAAISTIGGLVSSAILMKYQSDLAAKQRRKDEASAREAAKKAEEEKQRAADAAKFQAQLLARLGGQPVSNAQYTAAATAQAEQNTVNAVTQMTKEEIVHQNNMDQQIQQRESVSPVLYAAPAAVALVAMR